MKQVVIMPGGFHPFHAGHYALYKQAQEAFPGADVYVAATNDTSTRPFPFALKEKLAKLAGVNPGKFIQVKSPFRAMEIVGHLDPTDTQLIFVRSTKDADKPPQAGGIKKDGSPAYLQLLKGQEELAPMAQHAYMAYLPTVEFGPGMTSATEIRTAWPTLNEKRKTALVMSLYPKTQTSPALAANVVKMLDTAMGGEELNEFAPNGFDGFEDDDRVPMHFVIEKDRYHRRSKWKKSRDADGVILFTTKQQAIQAAEKFNKIDPNREFAYGGTQLVHVNDDDLDEGFDKEEFRRHMEQLRAREELRKTDPVSAKALDLRRQLPQQSKKKPEDDSMSINDPRHPGYAYTQAGQYKLDEFAPDEGGGSRKFIPWPEFIEQVKQIVGKDFECVENVVKSTIKARFVPHDPMEYGPTMLYSYYETRAGGRNKGAVSTRGSIQVGKYYPNTSGLGDRNFITQFSLLKGHPFERHFDLTFDNIYKIANIIKGNTQGAYQMPQTVSEGTIERKINRLQQMVQSYHDRARATKNDIKKQHYTDMANQLAGELDNLIGDYNEHERAGNEIARHDEEPSKIWEDYIDEKK